MTHTHGVWPFADAFDWSGDGGDEPMEETGLGEQVWMTR